MTNRETIDTLGASRAVGARASKSSTPCTLEAVRAGGRSDSCKGARETVLAGSNFRRAGKDGDAEVTIFAGRALGARSTARGGPRTIWARVASANVVDSFQGSESVHSLVTIAAGGACGRSGSAEVTLGAVNASGASGVAGGALGSTSGALSAARGTGFTVVTIGTSGARGSSLNVIGLTSVTRLASGNARQRLATGLLANGAFRALGVSRSGPGGGSGPRARRASEARRGILTDK